MNNYGEVYAEIAKGVIADEGREIRHNVKKLMKTFLKD